DDQQLQGSHSQFAPHLHPCPPSAVRLCSAPSEYIMAGGATPEMRVAVVVLISISGYIPHPLHPLPHWQPDPHPQFPPQQDIFL
ncbi:hypothetical protein, partial [Vibrio vulnificus]|uniref:hypothetical protein n=1 Tax=Vibrio vulnificus TaxID=672 RepID=UPI001CC95895